MYQKIILAVDAAPASLYAAEQVFNLARSEESEVIVVSVVPAYQGDLRLLGDAAILDQVREPYEKALEKVGEMAAERGIRCRCELHEGEPYDEVLSLAARRGADLIAVGKKENPLMDLVPIGSMASRVLRLSEIDVLVIPPMRPIRLERVFLAYDGSAGAKAATEKACVLAMRYGSVLAVGTIYELSLEGFARSPELSTAFYKEAEKTQSEAIARAAKLGVRHVVPVIAHGEPVYRALAEQASRQDCGLIVIGSQGKTNFRRMLLGSVTERVIAVGDCPVLVVKS